MPCGYATRITARGDLAAHVKTQHLRDKIARRRHTNFSSRKLQFELIASGQGLLTLRPAGPSSLPDKSRTLYTIIALMLTLRSPQGTALNNAFYRQCSACWSQGNSKKTCSSITHCWHVNDFPSNFIDFLSHHKAQRNFCIHCQKYKEEIYMTESEKLATLQSLKYKNTLSLRKIHNYSEEKRWGFAVALSLSNSFTKPPSLPPLDLATTTSFLNFHVTWYFRSKKKKKKRSSKTLNEDHYDP